MLMKYELYSPLSVDECIRRLAALVEDISNVYRQSDRPLLGRTQAERFSVRLAGGVRNPFAPYFKGRLEPWGDGTMITGECRILKGAKIGAGIWVGLWLLGPCILTVAADVVLVGLLLALGDSLQQLDAETYRTFLTLPIMIWSLPVLGGLIALGFPALFIGLRRGDCEKILALFEDILEVEGSRRRTDAAVVDKQEGLGAP
jgi:hypothetical protein